MGDSIIGKQVEIEFVQERPRERAYVIAIEHGLLYVHKIIKKRRGGWDAVEDDRRVWYPLISIKQLHNNSDISS
jgi:hypothetical protein